MIYFHFVSLSYAKFCYVFRNEFSNTKLAKIKKCMTGNERPLEVQFCQITVMSDKGFLIRNLRNFKIPPSSTIKKFI